MGKSQLEKVLTFPVVQSGIKPPCDRNMTLFFFLKKCKLKTKKQLHNQLTSIQKVYPHETELSISKR